MAANDTAALVVALSAQLTKFEKDMKQAVVIADKHTKQIEGRFEQMNTAITGKMSTLAASAAGNLGFLGTLLTTLGPVGLTAAAAVGAVVGSVLALGDAAKKFVEKTKALKEGADTIGITMNELKLLGQVGRTVGLDFDQTQAFFTKFISNIEALRSGGGPLYDELLKIDKELLRQLSVTKDSAQAIDLLVAAFKRLTDQQQRLALARAAGGRGGLVGVEMFEKLAQQGGLSGIVAKAPPALDDKFLRDLVDVDNRIKAIQTKTQNIWGKMFAKEEMAYMEWETNKWHELALYVERVKAGKEAISYSDVNQRLFNNRFAPAVEKPLTERGMNFEDRYGPARELESRPELKRAPAKGSPAVELEILQRNIALLGDAATETEKYRLKKLELQAATSKDPELQSAATRSLEAYKVAMMVTASAVRERLGIATEEEMAEARMAQLKQDAIRYRLTENEVLKAQNILLRENKEAADRLAVRRSIFPNFTQASQDALNFRKQIDQLATSSIDRLAEAMTAVSMGTQTMGEAFRSLGLTVLAELQKMIIKMLLFRALSGVTGGGDMSFASALGIGRNAGGTNNWSGGPTWVGEQGPEIVNLPKGSQVIPNSVAAGMGGVVVGGAQISIHAPGADAAGLARVEAAVIKLNQTIESRAVKAVTQARSRRMM
jgi:hypothetical protein